MRIIFPYDGYEHLGIGYLASILREAGHQVILMPLQFGDYISGYKTLKLKQILHMRNLLLARKPDVVAFSLTSPLAGSMIEVAREVREFGIKTIAGGPHASAEPEITVKSGAFDALIVGEAEEILGCMIKAMFQDSHVSLPWMYTPYQKATQFPPFPDINKLPFPAKDLFYKNHPYLAKDYQVIGSRGCPYNCVFCSDAHRKGGPSYRKRNQELLISELIWAKQNFSPQSVYFLDDIFTLDKKWLVEFLKIYKKEVQLPFHAISHPQHFDEHIAHLMHEAGCFALRIGVQTLTPHVRKSLDRNEKTDDVIRAIKAAKQARIRVEIDHMIDLPNETLEEARHAVAFYNNYRPDSVKVYWLMPLPGSRWFDMAQGRGRLSEEKANKMKQGKGYGIHSYLFAQNGYSDPRWLGIHTLLVYLTNTPKFLIRLLLRLKADRYLRPLSLFVLTVGMSRLLHVFRGWDKVGESHLKRLWNRLFTKVINRRI